MKRDASWAMLDGDEVAGPEPITSSQIPTGIEALVAADIAARQAAGLAKYGVSVAENPLARREWLQHAYEEALDLAIYLRRAMAEEGRGRPSPGELIADRTDAIK